MSVLPLPSSDSPAPSPTASSSSSSQPHVEPTPPPVPPPVETENEVIWVLNSEGSLSNRKHLKGKQAVKRSLSDALQLYSGDLAARKVKGAPDMPKRQTGASYPACDNVGNEILSCYPLSNTSVFQGDYTKFIWNARYPDFIGARNVDIYLYHADSEVEVLNWKNIPNAQSQVPVRINDSFWDDRAAQWTEGTRQNFTYYFIITGAGRQLTGGEQRQATWTAVQTRPGDAQIISGVTASRSGPTPSATGGLQNTNNNNSNDFPGWAIALLVVLGFLAIASMAGFGYLLVRHTRRKDRQAANRHSMGSDSPMMAQVGSVDPHSPTTVGPHGSGSYSHGYSGLTRMGSAAPVIPASALPPPGPIRSSSILQSNINDGASTRSVSDTGPFSGHDAAIMADAFRKALRKPDFAGLPPAEGDSPEQPEDGSEAHKEVMSRELAEEGRDIRSVSSQRGVKVENLDGNGESDETVDGKKTPTTRKTS